MKYQVTMNFDRETTGTYLYKAPDPKSVKVQNVYVKKTAFQGEPPRAITVTIETPEN